MKFQDVHLNEAPTGEPIKSAPPSDLVVEGTPAFKTWEITDLPTNVAAAGIWEASPGAWRSMKGSTSEFFTMLSGLSEFEEQGGATTRFQAGDTFIMRAGCVGIWRVIETTRKSFVTFQTGTSGRG